MKKLLFYFTSLFLVIFSAEASILDTTNTADIIRFRIETDLPGEKIKIRGASLISADDIIDFYTERYFSEVWSKNGVLKELAYELRFEIKQSQFDGLNPEDYHLAIIESFFERFEANKKSGIENDPGDLADIDLLLSDAFFYLSNHLEIGKVDPTIIGVDWEITRKNQHIDYKKLLNEAIKDGYIHKKLENLYPKFSIYKKGREVLRELIEEEKADTLNWAKVKIAKAIKVGETNSIIPIIRARMQYWGILGQYEFDDPELYDSLMMKGVKEFQGQHGIEKDGVVGNMTLAAMNDSPKARIEKARVNLERLRWLPDTVANTEFILVNIANFQLDYISSRDTLFSARVIVGKKYHESPIFSADMSYIVFSPYWNIPYSITKSEIIPSARKNPNYISSKNMEVITQSGKVVNPNSVDWNSKSFPYLVRQKPGPGNSLGMVKFMFPNKHNVYIHDTNARSLFETDDRARSHGCIRVQNPQDFAKVLLASDPKWTLDSIRTAMNQTKEQVVKLDRSIPVVLVYLTFWADSKGEAQFRNDIYDRDAPVLKALMTTK